MTCEECEELLGVYVLDIASLEERMAVEQHIAGCPRCIEQLREMRSVVGVLPFAAPQVQPPASLRDRILNAVHEPELAHKSNTIRPFRPVALPVSEQGARTVREPQVSFNTPAASTSRPARRTRTRSWVMPLLVAAALLFVVLSASLAAWNVSLQHQVTSVQATVTRSAALDTYTFKGTNTAPGATGQVVYLPQQHLTVLVVRGLPKLSNTQVYQGWLLHGKQVMSIGLLTAQPDGTITANYKGDLQDFDTAAVSQEPGPFATLNAPKGPIVATSPLSQT
jgi:hypothetical protein